MKSIRMKDRNVPAAIRYTLAIVLIGLSSFVLTCSFMRHPSRSLPKAVVAENSPRWSCVLEPMMLSPGEPISLTVTTPASTLPEEITVSSQDGKWSEVLYQDTPIPPSFVREETRTRSGSYGYRSSTTSTVPSQVLYLEFTPPSSYTSKKRFGFTLLAKYLDAEAGESTPNPVVSELIWTNKTTEWNFPGPYTVRMDKFLLWWLTLGAAVVVATSTIILSRRDIILTAILAFPVITGCIAGLFYADDANRSVVEVVNRMTGIWGAVQLTLLGMLGAIIPSAFIAGLIIYLRTPAVGHDKTAK